MQSSSHKNQPEFQVQPNLGMKRTGYGVSQLNRQYVVSLFSHLDWKKDKKKKNKKKKNKKKKQYFPFFLFFLFYPFNQLRFARVIRGGLLIKMYC